MGFSIPGHNRDFILISVRHGPGAGNRGPRAVESAGIGGRAQPLRLARGEFAMIAGGFSVHTRAVLVELYSARYRGGRPRESAASYKLDLPDFIRRHNPVRIRYLNSKGES